MSVRNWSSRIGVHPQAKSSSCAHLTRRRGLLKVCDQTATLITPLYYVSLFKLHISNALCVCACVRALLCLSPELSCNASPPTECSLWHERQTTQMHTLAPRHMQHAHDVNPGAECQRAGGMWPGDLGLQTSTWRPDTGMVCIGRGGQNSSGVQ